MHETNGSITISSEGIFIPKAAYGQDEKIVATLRQAGALAASRQVLPPTVRKIPDIDRPRELHWLREHGTEYAGQWVALQADRLLSHGNDARSVFAAAEASGVESPFFAHLPAADALPFGGW